MPIPLILIALGSGIGGGIIGAITGFIFGSSRAQERIAQLQERIAELVRMNVEREKEIQNLREEISRIKTSRGTVEKLLRYFIREVPEILDKYHRIQAIQEEQKAHEFRVEELYEQIREEHPVEMEEFEREIAAKLSACSYPTAGDVIP